MKFLDLFAGIGGFRMGMERAGHKCVGYVEIDKFARQSYQAIYNTEGEWTAHDITQVKDEEWRKFRGKVDVITGGFPCTPAGAKVKTSMGYKNIEDIKKGDMVLTHKGRYQRVVTPMSKVADHYNDIKATGVYDLRLTDEHPLYIYNQETDDFEWVDAKDIDKNKHLLAFNINQACQPTNLSHALLWLLGRYVADGYYDANRSSRVTFAVRKEKLGEFISKVKEVGVKYNMHHQERAAIEVSINNKDFRKLAEKFGHLATGKKVPEFILNAPVEEVNAFINGYLSGDGHVSSKRTMWSTVSEELALGLQALFIKAWHRLPSVYVRVDNRKATFNDTYNSQLRPTSRTTFVKGNYMVSKIRKVDRVEKEIKVYNIEVENDNSYTIRNTIVHNCQSFSIAGKRLGFADETRGTLFFEIARAAKEIQPSYLFLENVKGLLSSITPISYTDAVRTINNDIKEHSELWETKRPLALKQWKELDDNLTNILLKKFVSENIFQKEQLDTLSKKDLEFHLEQLGAKAEAGLMRNLQYCVTQISQTMKKSKNFQDVLMRVFDKQGEDIISSLNQLSSIESLRTMDTSMLETMVGMFVEIDLLLNNQLEESSEKMKLSTISTDEKQMTDQKTYSFVTELPTLAYIIRQWELLQRSWRKALLLLTEKKESTFYAKTFKIILSVLDELGYDVEWQLCNSKNFGVPQNRERVIIIGHLRGASTREVFFDAGQSRQTTSSNEIKVIGNTSETGYGSHDVLDPTGLSTTLMSRDYKGPKQVAVHQVGNISDSSSFGGNPQTGRVYDPSGISPTLNTMQGGGREPKIIDDQGRKNKKVIPTDVSPTLRAQSHGNEPKVAIPVLTPDRINKRQNGRRFKTDGEPMFTLDVADRHGVLFEDGTDNLRIRKLTPRECWRLQGFPDWAFDKAKGAGLSNSQLYKQAGNSVTVPLMEFVAKRL